jgi:hypothetical protein
MKRVGIVLLQLLVTGAGLWYVFHMPLVNTVTALPISFGGVGVRDAVSGTAWESGACSASNFSRHCIARLRYPSFLGIARLCRIPGVIS